ncbi:MULTISPECIES: CBS domain-containing protein [unclassified Caballeronia]|uniref:CBS domain-containing protein n=1 Tax=unclassified Caballeronia TaxID=2646786 RepID=UPI002028C063|nr:MULTISPECIES: CBS domain-containing protein [unclassified Caballeronia]
MSTLIFARWRALLHSAVFRFRFRYPRIRNAFTSPNPRGRSDALLEQLEQQARFRMLLDMRCAQVMHAPVTTITADATIHQARALLDKTGYKLLPVTDREGRLVGVVTREDFSPPKRDLRVTSELKEDRQGGELEDKGQRVQTVMQSDVSTVDVDTPISEVIPRFMANGHHHIPVVRNDAELVGMLTQSDLLLAVCGGR